MYLTGLVCALMEQSRGCRSTFTFQTSTFCWLCKREREGERMVTVTGGTWLAILSCTNPPAIYGSRYLVPLPFHASVHPPICLPHPLIFLPPPSSSLSLSSPPPSLLPSLPSPLFPRFEDVQQVISICITHSYLLWRQEGLVVTGEDTTARP